MSGGPLKVERHQVPEDVEGEAMTLLVGLLARRSAKHGRGAYCGPHEAMGVLEEEVRECQAAVRGADQDATDLALELLDVAGAALWGVASLLHTRRARPGLLPPPPAPKLVKAPEGLHPRPTRGHSVYGPEGGTAEAYACQRCGAPVTDREKMALPCPEDPWGAASRKRAQEAGRA